MFISVRIYVVVNLALTRGLKKYIHFKWFSLEHFLFNMLHEYFFIFKSNHIIALVNVNICQLLLLLFLQQNSKL